MACTEKDFYFILRRFCFPNVDLEHRKKKMYKRKKKGSEGRTQTSDFIVASGAALNSNSVSAGTGFTSAETGLCVLAKVP